VSAVNAAPLLAAAGGDYQISRSVRLRSSASAYLNRTPAGAGNLTKWTYSCWVKRGLIGNASQYPTIISATLNSSFNDSIYFNASTDTLVWNVSNTLTALTTTQVFRDTSAWYHLVFVWDTTNATASNRAKMYVNGVEITSFSTDNRASISSRNSAFNQNIVNFVAGSTNAVLDFDGYLTEVNFIDGQALTPSSFGETDSITGVWKPKKYAGTYGTNGFYLNFADNSAATAAAIGKDSSGNGNNWTPNNISVTAGVTYDSMLDTPTPYADGGNGRGNYCTLNPVDSTGNQTHTVYGGNLNWQTNTSVGGSNYNQTGLTFSNLPSSGLHYFEFVVNNISAANTGYIYFQPIGGTYIWWTYGGTSQIVGSNGTTSIGALSNGDVIQLAINTTTGKLWYGRNGTWYTTSGTPDPAAGTGASHSFTVGGVVYPAIQGRTGNSAQDLSFNFGQRPFAYTPPTGFKALNTQNLPDATIKKGNAYFDVLTYTGDGTDNRVITGLNFQPDLAAFKTRNVADNFRWVDAVRGVNKFLLSNTSDAETTDTTMVSSFNSNGVTFGTDTSDRIIWSAKTYAAFAWKESASAGFDIVTGTTPASGNFTVSHSLGVTPSMFIFKRRSNVSSWGVWHKNLAGGTSYLILESTGAQAADATVWTAAPSSTVLNIGSAWSAGGAQTYVGYCFSEVAGFSKFDSYTGNGSADGPFVYCGFRPRWIMVKSSSGISSWWVYDSARDTYNAATNLLRLDLSNADTTQGFPDLLSNGFKIRNTGQNNSGETYIYAAFAENPFKNSLAR